MSLRGVPIRSGRRSNLKNNIRFIFIFTIERGDCFSFHGRIAKTVLSGAVLICRCEESRPGRDNEAISSVLRLKIAQLCYNKYC